MTRVRRRGRATVPRVRGGGRVPARARAAAYALVLLAAALLSAQEPAGQDRVWLLEIDGVINPLSDRYLERELNAAERAGARAVVLRIDTPGGLETSMRAMAETLLAARVPVIAYVAPAGARAASAGMFVTIAAHIAAMAPATNIGAAHPVSLGGGQADTVAVTKAVSDAAALARSIAAARGRNAEWAEAAVRRSVSVTAEEALELDAIDVVAPDLPALLAEVDGREVVTAVGAATLRTAGAQVLERPMSLAERILQTITDPNIAYILFTIGVIGILAELYNPGILLPGITGAISLILAFVAFGSLPVSWAGVLLLVGAVAIVVVDLATEGLGVLAIAGLVAFVLGSLMLYRPPGPVSPALPAVSVSPWVVVTTTVVLGALLALVLRALLRARRVPITAGVEALVGSPGTALTDLAPEGSVRVAGETWSARARGAGIAAGKDVTVVGVTGVVLEVEPVAEEPAIEPRRTAA